MKRLFFSFLLSISLLCASSTPSAPNSSAGFSDRRYHVQSGDVLQLSYRYTPEYDEALTVQPDGYVTPKLIGDVHVEGLNLDEVRETLRKALSARLNDPEITLTLQEFVHPAFVATGQIAAPGKYEIHGRVSLIEAVAMAGGFKDNAKHSQVLVLRRVDNQVARTFLVDAKRLTDPHHPHFEEDLNIQPGDLIVVPKNRISKIADYVHWVNFGAYVPILQ